MSRPFRPSVPLAYLFLAGCLQACLFSSGGLGASGEKPPGGGNPSGGNPPRGRGFYVFDFPTESSRLNLDSSYGLKWHASDSAGPGPVRMSLYRNDSLLGPVMGSLRATGSLDLTFALMPNIGGFRLGSGSGYRLRITSEEDSSKWDSGPAFTLYSDYSGSLELTAPAAGAQVRGDSAIRIAWSWTGKMGGQVGLELYRDTTLVWPVETVSADLGQFSWSNIPEGLPSGGGYRFRIYSKSDANIQRMGPAFTLILPVLAGAYEFVRPRSDDVWTAGGTGDVEWTVTGNPGAYSLLTLWRDSPRELITGWTPSDTHAPAGQVNVPANLAGGTYRLRISSLADSTLFAFSPAFTIQ